MATSQHQTAAAADADEADMAPFRPGQVLRQTLENLGMSAGALARALDVPTRRVTGILNGERGISADTALRLARCLGTAPVDWLELQMAADLHRAKADLGDTLGRVRVVSYGTNS